MMELQPPDASTAQYGDFGVQNGSVPSLESTLQPLPLDPWDVELCVSGTIISCENAALLALLAVLVVTPAFRVPVFLLVGSLAAADLLVGLRLILRFTSIYLVPSEALALGTAGLLLAAFTASVRSVLAIAAERFVSLQHALTYSSGRAAGPGSRCCSPGEHRCAAGRCPPCAGTACGIRPPAAPSGRSAGPTSPPFPSPSWPPSPCCCSSVRRSAASPSAHTARGRAEAARRAGGGTARTGTAALALTLGAFAASWLPFAALCPPPAAGSVLNLSSTPSVTASSGRFCGRCAAGAALLRCPCAPGRPAMCDHPQGTWGCRW